jgi:integrase
VVSPSDREPGVDVGLAYPVPDRGLGQVEVLGDLPDGPVTPPAHLDDLRLELRRERPTRPTRLVAHVFHDEHLPGAHSPTDLGYPSKRVRPKERDVPLPGTTAARLAAHLEQWPAIQVTLPWLVPTGKPVTRTLVFTGRERTGINRNYYNSHLWKPALVVAGVIGPKVGEYYDPSREHGFHALRHAYASWLLAHGVDIRSLAGYLGHADPRFTLRVYTHLMPSSEEKTRKAIDLALGAAVDGLPSSFVPGLYRAGA